MSLIMALCAISSTPHDFEVDGIYYMIEENNAIVTFCGNYYFSANEYLGDITIPTTVTYNGITYSIIGIGDYAFGSCNGLTSVTIGDSVITIGNNAFIGCSGLISVFIGNSVTTIGDYAFSYCRNLTNLNIPNSVSYIGDFALDETPWFNSQQDGLIYIGSVAYKYKGTMSQGTNITLRDGTLSISNRAFRDCTGLASITIPNSVTSIGSATFFNCSGLTNVVIPILVTSINETTFYGCRGLTKINIPNSVTTIGSLAFYDCTSLTNVNIPNSVTSIGNSAFSHCSGLTNITIPNSVTHIGEGAFCGCGGLTSVAIGNSVTFIGKESFMDAPSIETVTCTATTPPLWDDLAMFTMNVYNHAQLHVPSDSERTYKLDPYWGQFLAIIGDANGDNPSDDSDYMKCDTNGDGEVNIADVNKVIDAILNH